MLDKHGRKINYLRVSVTDRCNLRCVYCMPPEGIVKKEHDNIMRYEEIFNVVKEASLLGIDKIRFTGGEPLILKDIDKLIYNTSKISSIKDIAMTTNAIPVETDKSSTALLYKFKESKENIGFISPMSCKFCSGCNRVRLTAEGTLKPCLHSEKEVNLKNYVGNNQALLSKINEAIYNKPLEHHMIEEEKSKSKKMMYQIGG